MTINTAAWVCLCAPLVAAVLITLAGERISRRAAGYLSTASTFVAFGAAIVALISMLGESPDARSHTTTAWTWLSAGQYSFGLTMLTDQLSIMMMLIVTGVGALIVAYSVGYMEGENEERRYFAYMSLFVFSMLLLVQSGNLLLLLAGWGMVGLSSYLLIGFYQQKPEAIAAAKKAFIMNAFGDATMALALFLLIQQTGQLDFAGVFAAAPHGGTIANLIALGLLGGAVAKSAQIPLHTWLPGRDGRPDAGQRPDPRRHDGHGRRLPDRPHEPALPRRAQGAGPRGRARPRHAADRGSGRARPGRHQARDRLLDDVADRLHVRRGGHRRLLGRDVPPDGACLLQGPALPRPPGSSSMPFPASRTCGGWAGCERCSHTRGRPS